MPLGTVPKVRAGTDEVRPRGRAWAAWLARLHPWVAAPSALALLLYPNPFIATAAVVGALPLLGRWIAVGRPWPRTILDLPLALLLAGGLLGATAGLNAEAIAMRLSGLLAGIFLYAAMVTHVVNARRARAVTLLLLGLSIVGSLALVNMVSPFLHLSRLPLLETVAQSLDPWGLTRGLSDEDELLKRYRLRPSGVGALADMGLALAFAAGLGLSAWRSRAFLLIPLALFSAVLFVTDSRASLLAGAVTVGALAGFWNTRLLPLIPLSGLAVLLLAGAGLATKGLNLRTIGQRFWFWENSVYLAQEYPITGVGLGTQSVQLTYRTYFMPSFPAFSHAHNIYLQMLLEQGVLGMLALVALTFGAIWLGWRARLAPDRWVRAGGMAGLGMALALVTTGLGEITAVSPIGSALLLMALGLVAAAGSSVVAAARAADSRPGIVARLRARAARHRRVITVVVALAVTIGALAGGGARLAATTLLNFGSIEVNRALVSEETTKEERERYLDQALWLLRTAEGLDETNPSIQRNLAIALAAKDDNRRARQAADRARDLTDPTDQRALFQVGRAYAAVGNWADAIRAWESAGASQQLLLLGNRLLRGRNWDQAIAAFEATAAIDPESRSAYEGIIRGIRGDDGSSDEIDRRLQSTMRVSDENEYFARLELARYHRDEQRLMRALDEVRRAGRIRVGADHALVEGTIFVQLGRYAEAEPLLERATAALREQLGVVRDDPLQPNTSPSALGPDGLDAYYWLAFVQARTGDHERAVTSAREALENADGARRAQRAALLGLMGDSLLALGRPDDARDIVAEALVAVPDDPHLLESRAHIAAVLDGAPRNLVANPGFEWVGAWRLVPEGDPAESDLLASDPAAVGRHAARIVAGPTAHRYAAQLITGLEPGATYRLRARVRTQDLLDGRASMRLVGRGQPTSDSSRAVSVWVQAETRQVEWSTLDQIFVAPATSASLDIGFPEGANPGAAVWFDQISLTALERGR